MGNTVDKVLNVAKNEIGYLEKSTAAYKKDPDIIYQKTEGAGYDNITKYGKEMHSIYPAVMDFPAAWCDCFVDYCFYLAYGITTAKSLLCGNFDDYTVASATMFYKHGALNREPKVGDQIFFSRDGSLYQIYHTGIVTEVTDSVVKTIEGNTSQTRSVEPNGGGVFEKSYSRASRTIVRAWFGHPKYDESEPGVETQSDAAAGAAKTQHAQLKIKATKYQPDRHITGTYSVTASTLELRRGAGTEFESMGAMLRGTKVQCYGYFDLRGGKRWYLVYCPQWQITGYCSSEYLKKI